MKPQEHKDLSELVTKPGWKVYLSLLDREYKIAYARLRNSNKELSDRTNGLIDGIEKAQRLADRAIDEYVPEQDQQP